MGAIVRDGVEGICTAATPVSLAAGLSRLLDDDDRWLLMSAAALRRAAEYDWPAVAAQLETFMAGPACG